MLLETYKEGEDEKEEMTEDEIINDMISKILPSVAPKYNKKELKDKDLLKILNKVPKPQNMLKMTGKKVNMKTAKESNGDEYLNMIQRNIDKKLKKTINSKVANLIKNNKELDKINKPKEEIYKKIAHRVYEAQEAHQLYNGEAILTTTEKGVQVKKVSDDAKVLILYASNLILFSKKSDAVKAIDEYGKYFYNKDL